MTNDQSIEKPTVQLLLDPLKAGLMEMVTLVPATTDNPNAELKITTNNREFKMMATIVSIPPLWNNNVSAGQLVGGSSLIKFISEQEKVGSINLESTNGSFTIHLNQHKEISSVSAIIVAKDFSTAVKEFLSRINPYLSLLSWKYRVPLYLTNINAIDLKNSYQFAKFIQPIPQKEMAASLNEPEFSDERLLALFSFQREMLNSVSGSYRLLCVHKCLTIINVIKNDVRQKAIKRQLDLKNFKNLTEVIIENSDLNVNIWPEAIGWKLGRLVDEKIRPLRNKIAHEFDDGTNFANPDLGIFSEQTRDYADALIPLMRLAFEKIVDYHDKYLFEEK